MRRVLRLALKGRGHVSPNPRVGAIIVSPDGRVLGTGYHSRFGEQHAETAAIEACNGQDLRGAALYVNLEPCCHEGKTPPCCTAIIKAGIERVVASTTDPNAQVYGRGFAMLKSAGIKVDVGILASEARYLNRGYFSSRERGRAWCAVKVALSLDGKMAAPDGQSKWITGTEARKLAHAMRADHDGVLVGSGTVRLDNPELTVRSVRGPNPVRIILAPNTGIPEGCKLAKSASSVRTIIVAAGEKNPPGSDIRGIEILRLPNRGNGRIDPEDLLTRLPLIGVQSLLIEGGSSVLSSFMKADQIDEISIGIAPSIVGKGISPFEHFSPSSWEERPKFFVNSIKRYGKDIVIRFSRKAN